MNITRFKAEHLSALELQDSQAYFGSELMTPGYGLQMEAAGGFTAIADDGVVLGCGGCVEVWAGRAIAWALVSRHAGRNMRAIHRAVEGYFQAAPFRRVEAWVDEGFDAGERWLVMLGFQRETPEPMRGFRPDGGACFLYSRVK